MVYTQSYHIRKTDVAVNTFHLDFVTLVFGTITYMKETLIINNNNNNDDYHQCCTRFQLKVYVYELSKRTSWSKNQNINTHDNNNNSYIHGKSL